jgi:hypothetical protein
MLASAHLPHYKIFESKQAVERLANEYGAEVMEVQMALWIWSFMRVLEHFPIRLAIPRVCKEGFAFFFGNLSEKRSDRFPKRLNSTRLHFA